MTHRLLFLAASLAAFMAGLYLGWLYIQWGWMASNPSYGPAQTADFASWSVWSAIGSLACLVGSAALAVLAVNRATMSSPNQSIDRSRGA